MARIQLALSLILLHYAITVSAKNTRFHDFFPIYRDAFLKIRDESCSDIFALKEAGAEVCHEVLDCMLEHTSESIKSDMASGLVALGLMPAILTYLGSSTAETVLLSRRRPLLAFLIASGSPAVNPLPTFVYPNPLEELRARENHLAPRHFSPWQATAVSALEYVLIAAAIANVYTAAYSTGYATTNTISCDTVWYPTLWAVLTLCIHLFGMWCLALRVKTAGEPAWRKMHWKNGVRRWFKHEATPCITHEKLVLVWKPETYLFVAVSWWTSIMTTAHLLFGTIAFSSLQFLGEILFFLRVSYWLELLMANRICRQYPNHC